MTRKSMPRLAALWVLLPALALLGRKPNYPLTFMDDYLDREKIRPTALSS